MGLSALAFPVRDLKPYSRLHAETCSSKLMVISSNFFPRGIQTPNSHNGTQVETALKNTTLFAVRMFRMQCRAGRLKQGVRTWYNYIATLHKSELFHTHHSF